MRSFLLAGAVALLGCFGVPPAVAHNCGHGDHDSDHCWNSAHHGRSASSAAAASNTQTLEGKLAEIVYLPGATAESGMVEIRLQSAGQSRLVRLAPAGFLKQGGLHLREGDALTVIGFPVSAMEGDLLVATEIRQGDHRLALRDNRGRPIW